MKTPQKEKTLRSILISAMICAALLVVSACSAADISEYGDYPIVIAGLEDEELTVTPNMLSEMECVSRTASGKTEKAGTVNAAGPLLDTFLEQYGKKMSDFKKIRFIASDEYRVVLKDEYLTDYEVVLAVSSGSEPLDESCRPLRILIPEAESYMWVYAVIRIEFEE